MEGDKREAKWKGGGGREGAMSVKGNQSSQVGLIKRHKRLARYNIWRESVKFEVLNLKWGEEEKSKEREKKVKAAGGAAWRKVNMDDQHINSRSNKSWGRVTSLHLPQAPSGRGKKWRRGRKWRESETRQQIWKERKAKKWGGENLKVKIYKKKNNVISEIMQTLDSLFRFEKFDQYVHQIFEPRFLKIILHGN